MTFAETFLAYEGTKSPRTIYAVALAHQVHVRRKSYPAVIRALQALLFARPDAMVLKNFAKDIRGANVRKIQDAFEPIADAAMAYLFARDVRGASVKRLQEVVIRKCLESRNAKYLYTFARDIPSANRKKLGKIISELGDAGWISAFESTCR